MTSDESAESPIACDLAAMEQSQQGPHQFLLQQWTRAIQAREELLNGYMFRFEPDDALWVTLAEFITFERRCCPFLKLSLTRERDNGPMRLCLTGLDGVRQLLRSEPRLG